MWKKIFLFFLIIALGFFLRIYDINWDQGTHINPDERFLTMVGVAEKIPQNLALYFDPAKSTLNPVNVGFGFFVYGTFPLTVNKFLAIVTHMDIYDGFNISGRFLAAVADTLVIFFVFKTTQILCKQYGFKHFLPFFASFLYATAVLPIQLSHFFISDPFLNLFSFASFYFALHYSYKRDIKSFLASSICIALALACKITAIFITPLIAVFIIRGIYLHHRLYSWRSVFTVKILSLILWGSFYCLISYGCLRIGDPYLFNTPNIFTLTPNHIFMNNIHALESYDTKDAWYPPGVQWIHKSYLSEIANIALFGTGLPYFFLLFCGIIFIFLSRKKLLMTIALWVLVFIAYQDSTFSKPLRYFIFVYPFFSVFAAIGFTHLFKKHLKLILPVSLLILLIWPLSFFSIYSKNLSRVTASQWIYQNIPNSSIILGESWDDALPLSIPNTYGKTFNVKYLPVFDPDTTQKWQQMNQLLNSADYYILSSNRGWGSIPTVPERYPIMTKFYEDLFAGKTQYKKIAEFTSYPSLTYLGIPVTFPDDIAEESFTVYDHPHVIIFKNTMQKLP